MNEGSNQKNKFCFDMKTQEKAKKILKRYPAAQSRSAVMPLLELAQQQNGGWLSKQAIVYIANYLKMPEIQVWEIATFYSMYFLEPVGRHVISVCGTTPCALRGCSKILKACEKWLGISVGKTTDDKMFTLQEVECLGACSNGPVVQINEAYYEDLVPEQMEKILVSLAEGQPVKEGSQIGRLSSEYEGVQDD
jgi:NADH-quinone oxidoreductase subunit E